MFHAQKPRNRFIALRRKNEERYDFYNNVRRTDERLIQGAQWETKMDNVLQSKRLAKRVDRLNRKYQQELEDRRSVLRKKFAVEKNKWEVELESLKETPQIIRKRLEKRAKQLKEEREKRSREFAKAQKDRMFIESSDEIRHARQRLAMLKHAKDQHKLLEEKRQADQARAVEESYYKKQYEEQYKRALSREERERKEELEKRAMFRQNIDVQLSEIEKRRERERKEEEEKNRIFHDRCRIEEEKTRADKLRRLRENQGVQMTIREYNKKKQEYTKRQMDEEKAFDLKMIKDITERERREMAAEKSKKDEYQKKQREYRSMLLKQMEKEKIDEAALDRLREEDMERQYAKQNARRQREQEAREQLMTQVLESRQQALLMKLERDREMEGLKVLDRVKVDKDIRRFFNEEDEKARVMKAKMMEHKQFLMTQKDEKTTRERGETQSQMEAEKKFQKKLLDYENELTDKLRFLNQNKPEEYKKINIMPKTYKWV